MSRKFAEISLSANCVTFVDFVEFESRVKTLKIESTFDPKEINAQWAETAGTETCAASTESL